MCSVAGALLWSRNKEVLPSLREKERKENVEREKMISAVALAHVAAKIKFRFGDLQTWPSVTFTGTTRSEDVGGRGGDDWWCSPRNVTADGNDDVPSWIHCSCTPCSQSQYWRVRCTRPGSIIPCTVRTYVRIPLYFPRKTITPSVNNKRMQFLLIEEATNLNFDWSYI